MGFIDSWCFSYHRTRCHICSSREEKPRQKISNWKLDLENSRRNHSEYKWRGKVEKVALLKETFNSPNGQSIRWVCHERYKLTKQRVGVWSRGNLKNISRYRGSHVMEPLRYCSTRLPYDLTWYIIVMFLDFFTQLVGIQNGGGGGETYLGFYLETWSGKSSVYIVWLRNGSSLQV